MIKMCALADRDNMRLRNICEPWKVLAAILIELPRRVTAKLAADLPNGEQTGRCPGQPRRLTRSCGHREKANTASVAGVGERYLRVRLLMFALVFA
jgi:hypothetical protein